MTRLFIILFLVNTKILPFYLFLRYIFLFTKKYIVLPVLRKRFASHKRRPATDMREALAETAPTVMYVGEMIGLFITAILEEKKRLRFKI